MTTRKYSSRSQQTTLTSGLSSSGTTASVVSASALLGGITITAGETFTVVLDPDTALEEIVDVTAVSSNNLTIVRGVDGSSGQEHSAGAVVRHMAIGRDLREANQHIENATSAHGLTIANVVSTTDTSKVSSGMIIDGAIGTAKIDDTAVTAAKLSPNAVTTTKIADSNVTTAKIADLNVTTGKIADSAITSAKIADGTIVAGDIADGAITSAKILDGTIATADLADGSVTSAKIADGTIVNADINSAAAIDKTKISGTAITAADTGTVTSTMIADGTIVNADINSAAAIAYSKLNLAGSITSSDIVDSTIVNADISPTAAIAKSKLDLGGTITSADIVDGTIVNSDISTSAAIALSKLATDPLARANHTGTQTASTISDFDTQVRSSRLDQMAQPTFDLNFNNKKITNLADPTSAQDAVTINYINNQKGANSGLASLDSSGKIPTTQLPALAVTDTFVVSSQAAMLALTAEVGDVAVRTDLNKSFILKTAGASTLANWQELLTPTDSVLSVDGQTGVVSLSSTYVAKTGDTMSGNLNMGTNKVTNLGTPTSNADAATKAYVDTVAGSAAAAAAAQAATEAVYDNFDDRYLGAKATAPTVDNDGNALLVGALYWNSTSNTMFAWSGTAWGSISSTAEIFRYKFTATNGQTSVSGTDDNGVTLAYLVGKEQVYLNGILLVRGSDYTASNGTSITSISAMASGDILEVITFTAFDISTAINKSVLTAKGSVLVASAAQTPGSLNVGTNGQVLTADSAEALGVKWATPAPGYTAPTLGSTSIASGATVTTIAGLTLTAPTLTGTVTASGDINLSGAGAVGSINDEFALILMGAL